MPETMYVVSVAEIYPGIYVFSMVCLGSTRRGAGKRPVLPHCSTRQKILEKCLNLKFLKNRKNTIKVIGILWTFNTIQCDINPTLSVSRQENVFRIAIEGHAPLEMNTPQFLDIARLMKTYIGIMVKTKQRR